MLSEDEEAPGKDFSLTSLNIIPQLLLAVVTYVGAEAEAQLPFMLPGFGFPLVYNTQPLKSPVYYYKVAEEQLEEENEKCRNNEGSLVHCAHRSIPEVPKGLHKR